MERGLRSMAAAVAVVGALAAGAAGAQAHAPMARTAANCKIGSGREFGYTYLTALSVNHTTCATGTSLAKHHGNVRGWRCTVKRLATSPVQYQARKTCTSGSREVVWAFSQNT